MLFPHQQALTTLRRSVGEEVPGEDLRRMDAGLQPEDVLEGLLELEGEDLRKVLLLIRC
jgi:hypothetical protein